MCDIIRQSLRWAILVSIVTALLAMVLSLVSSSFLNGLPWQGGLLVVLFIVLIGVFFDMLGIAATAAEERPFHAMASKKVAGARQSIGIVRKADQFANFCNDVIGDISGVVSGAAGFAVAAALILSMDLPSGSHFMAETLLIGFISALTVGGKALGKSLAIRYANEMVFQMGRIFYFLENRFHIRVFNVKNKKKRKRKRGVLRAPRTD
ncbi:hypothetical protein [Desmospora profundinema]|uniref:CBS domain containing-hemolysin-like protein n=1 Tax=Desmospora profundinema TaxID=1571184 RepID=A0ABU1IJT8_9BACL|nr:hypothetical protein [Desmospora profundinema]MDR6224643.1 CBS domain containing-hemolysin-like protein [Desmospora profundinema]